MKTSTAAAAARGDGHFEGLAEAVRRRAATYAGRPVFRVTVEDLFSVYLDGLAVPDRQPHNCHACKNFIERFGALVVVNDDGSTESIFWPDGYDAALRHVVPAVYASAVRDLAVAVRRAPIESVFLSGEAEWGVGRTGEWTHFMVPALSRFHHALLTPGQSMAEKREEYGMLQRGLADFHPTLVSVARSILETETLYRSEKCLGVARWLHEIHEKRASTKNTRVRDALTWLAVATAPAGFCHVRSTMIGTLLEDLAAGLPVDQVKRRFADKMHPLQYQRPSAPPSAGNIVQAEKAVEALKSAGALERRFAKLADIKPLWTPRKKEVLRGEPAGVFSHLRAKETELAPPVEIGSPITITWEKFARTVLPEAERVECLVPAHGSFIALVTAANPDAPPILQWDTAERRNPVSWYFYTSGARAADWNLRGGEFCEVTAFTLSPAKWDVERPSSHQANMAVAILAGARDLRHTEGAALFPETLKSEYHAFRRTIEAYSASATIAGRDEAEACGIALQGGGGAREWSVVFRVTSKGIHALYRPDRWD